jgi:hypothetical protein
VFNLVSVRDKRHDHTLFPCRGGSETLPYEKFLTQDPYPGFWLIYVEGENMLDARLAVFRPPGPDTQVRQDLRAGWAVSMAAQDGQLPVRMGSRDLAQRVANGLAAKMGQAFVIAWLTVV